MSEPKRPAASAKPPARRPRRAPESLTAPGNVLTPTPATDAELSLEAVSIRQRNAARLLAVGHTQQETADAVHVDVRTIRRWLDEPAFDELVRALHHTAWERIEPRVFANLEMALDVELAMLRGDIEAASDRYRAAKAIIDQRLQRFFAAAPADADADAAHQEDSRVLEGEVISRGSAA